MSGTPATPIDFPPDEPTAEELAAAGTMRPLEDLPSPWTVKGEPAILSQPTLSALSPEQRTKVLERAQGTDEASINRALNDFLRERSREVRIICGPGEGASETERTATDQANRMRLLGVEIERIEGELAEVADYQQHIGDDGKMTPIPVHRYQGDARTAREKRLRAAKYELGSVAGISGVKELDAATRADALTARELHRQATEAAEIRRMGEALLREERLSKAANAYAKHRRPVIG